MSRKLSPLSKKKSAFRVSERRRKVKLLAIEYKGGACATCGYDKCPASLVFHHTDPSKKDFGISSEGKTRSFESLKTELDQCILLCANCHNEVHWKERKTKYIMGSKIKGWHQKGPRKETRRMSEDNTGRKGKYYDRRDRKPNESKRVDLNRLPEQDF